MTTFASHITKGTLAARPAATAVPSGSLYSGTDTNLVYQSDGSAWSTWATLGSTGGSAMTYASYTPTLGASTTAPTLGTGGSSTGRYAQNGKFTHGSIMITAGTSGFNQGSGSLKFGLPVAAKMADTYAILGVAYWTTGGGSAVKAGFLTRLDTNTAQIIGTDGAGFGAGAATMSNNDVIMINFSYEAA